MNKNIYHILTGFILLTSSFSNWKSEDNQVTAGVNLSQMIPPMVPGLSEVWDQPNVDIEIIEGEFYSEINKWWRSGEDELEVLMVVGSSFDATKAYLLHKYIHTQAPDDYFTTPGEEYGLTVGDVRFVTIDEENPEGFSTLDFIGLIMLRAEGAIQNQLRQIAETIDAQLVENVRTETLEEQPQIPRINAFSASKTSVSSGDEVFLDLDSDTSNDMAIHYFWDMTEGGVRKDMLDKFLYQAAGKGSQNISLTVVNDIGLYGSGSLDLVVN